MNPARLLLSLALVCLFALPACSWFGDDPEADTGPARPVLVGRISSIPPDRRFVLIESYGKWDVPTESVLTTRGTEGRTANLRVTGEAIGPFAAADIQAGDVLVGDAVYTLPKPKIPAATTPPTEEAPATQDIPTPTEPTPANSKNS